MYDDPTEWLETVTLSDVRALRDALDENGVPYTGYLHAEIDSDNPAKDLLSQWENYKGDRDSYPKELRSWLDAAETALENDNLPPAPKSRYESEDGHTFTYCLACGAVYRDDEEKDCGCPVGVETMYPPDDYEKGDNQYNR